MNVYRKGSEVSWKWGNGEATAKVVSSHKETITRTIKGEEITRKGSDDNPAYVLEQEDGNRALKLHSELSKK
ncbi:hypervirulence associated TUDOR domain-containing protein [Actinokineospora bangkokensis]|uniref:Hypervirulence associated protein TUDOR domain-containing protein n=1 Tax=Actinokineospora bangkokensis TaxID=1193682 RepID=A0A1Q9LCC9_9PSEU|nr:DUF2945 domain-containing protein [Actinokineospora bangkokensis]OLR89687.1 hypothetical protein BJP25_01225 [Actinokineospora bangkokensis]